MQVAARTNGHTWNVLASRSRRAASRCCHCRARATSSSTSRATRSGSRAEGSSTCWGIVDTAGTFRPFWAHDRAQERRAVEGVIDLIRERRAADPAMHVYHYAAYEVTALKRLTCEYGTREEEVDDLLRGEVFVDLYRVVSARAAALARALRAEAGGDVLLRAPRRPARPATTRSCSTRNGSSGATRRSSTTSPHYNEEDCVSTLQLRDWLLAAEAGRAAADQSRRSRASHPRARRRPRSYGRRCSLVCPTTPTT